MVQQRFVQAARKVRTIHYLVVPLSHISMYNNVHVHIFISYRSLSDNDVRKTWCTLKNLWTIGKKENLLQHSKWVRRHIADNYMCVGVLNILMIKFQLEMKKQRKKMNAFLWSLV